MDTLKLVETLQNWRKGNEGQINGLSDQNAVLDQAIDVLTKGIEADQRRIDEAIKADTVPHMAP